MWAEVDLLTITKTRFAHEFEIKCSKADYNRELGNNHKYNKQTKHWRLQNPSQYKSKKHIPNYFWFVTHGFEIDPPEYAGWIKVEEYKHYPGEYTLYVAKNAPRIHSVKWKDADVAKIARLLSFRLLRFYTGKE